MKYNCGPAVADQLQAAADTYEDMAIGVLDSIVDSDDAIELLTSIEARLSPNPKARKPQDKLQALWESSVFDEATKPLYPCRRFAAHRHCQHLLELYFVELVVHCLVAVDCYYYWLDC